LRLLDVRIRKFGIEGKEMVPYGLQTRRVPGGLNDCSGLFL